MALVLVAVGIAGIALVAMGQTPSWVALRSGCGRAGMGIGMPAIAVLVLGQSPDAEQRFNSSAVQLSEVLATVMLVGLGGVLVNAFASTSHPVVRALLFDLLMAGVAGWAALIPAGPDPAGGSLIPTWSGYS